MAQQPPLTPEQLKRPPLPGDEFVLQLQKQKTKKYSELPAIYQAMVDGSLEREYVEAWLKDSYYYWDNLYRAVGGCFVKINHEELRSRVLVKMVNIEGKQLGHEWNGSNTPAYEELWLRLAEGLGVPRAEVLAWKPFSRTHFSISTLALYSHGYEWTWLDGIASLYAGDLHMYECMTQARDALRTRYQVPEAALAFFDAYLPDTEQDLQWEAADLAYLCCTTERQHTAGRAFRERLDIENQVALSVWVAREAEKGSDRVPTHIP